MLTYDQSQKLDGVAAQVARRFPPATLTERNGRVVLTVGPDMSKDVQAQICRFVYAKGFADFDLVTPDDPPAQPATAEWLAENRRGNHHLTDALASFR